MLACIKVCLTWIFNINNINASKLDNLYIGENNYYYISLQ